jgi:uncharacterized RDD family membrane protein YckC
LNNPNPISNPYAAPSATVGDVDMSGALEPAGRGTRLGAYLLDTFIAIAMIYGPFLALGGLGALQQAFASPDDPTALAGALTGAAGIGFLLGFVAWVVITIMLVVKNRQTIGKKILGIKVVRSDGSTIGIGRLFWLRNFVPGLLMAIPLVGYVVALVDPLMIFGEKRQCLHDRIADSIVVKA